MTYTPIELLWLSPELMNRLKELWVHTLEILLSKPLEWVSSEWIREINETIGFRKLKLKTKNDINNNGELY